MQHRRSANRGKLFEALPVVRTCRLLVTLAARRAGELPDNPGNDLRGTLGLALKGGCCDDACEGDCAHHLLFEICRPSSEQGRALRDVPRPFVLRPPLTWPGTVYRGEILSFDGFMPLLALGQRIHVGKGTAFGMGRYVVV